MTVTVKINRQVYTLTYNAQTGLYEGEIAAPGTPSVYTVAVTADNGNATYTQTKTLDVRRELTPPILTLTSPLQGAYVQDAATPITFTAMDEEDGSGIDLSTLKVEVGGQTYLSADMTCTARDNGYDCILIPQGLPDGVQTATIRVSDISGNIAEPVSVSYTVDTVNPALMVSWPPDQLATNRPLLTVTGTASDIISNPVTVTIQGVSTPLIDGAFCHVVALTEGDQTIVVTATDQAGRQTTITRAVLLDVTVPQVIAAHIWPDMNDFNLFYVSIELAASIVSPKSKETVTGTVNGAAVDFVEQRACYWVAKVTRAVADTYTMQILAADAAGNQTGYRITFPCGMECKWDRRKGDRMNVPDWIRIERNAQYLAKRLQAYGYYPDTSTYKLDWVVTDLPTRGHMNRIRRNIDALRNCFAPLPDWQEIMYVLKPEHTDINTLEWDEHIVDVWLERMLAGRNRYAGAFCAGQEMIF